MYSQETDELTVILVMNTHRFVQSPPICHATQLIVTNLQSASLHPLLSLFRLRISLNRSVLRGASLPIGKNSLLTSIRLQTLALSNNPCSGTAPHISEGVSSHTLVNHSDCSEY
jgi:hypothetical protein